MRTNPIGSTGVEVSEVGFGVWTIATGWWGEYSEADATQLLRDAYDAGITFFNTGNAYGADGYGERLVANALKDVRDNVTIATTFGYDLDAPREGKHGGHSERAHDWSADNIKRSLERSLEHLGTDSIDIWQLHNPRMDAMQNDELWETLYDLRSQGLVKALGPSIGPAIGWRDEGMFAIRERDIDIFHHIYNMLEQEPGNEFTDEAAERDIAVFVRVPHSSGLLEGHYDKDTTFDKNDHRSHRPKEWLTNGLHKVEQLQFLVDAREDATIGQVALKWLLSDPGVTCVQPNLYGIEQIKEFAAAPDIDEFDADELGEIDLLYRTNFGLDREPVGAGA
jgi:aryl-alcohol dehydrogenase-like predicted oxidoreductase